MKCTFTNVQLVTLAVYLIGGEAERVDTEDIAVKANEIAPVRFSWRKYPEQINIDTVRKRLWDATKPGNGGLLIGSEKSGWLLTQDGLEFARSNVVTLSDHNFVRKPLSQRDRRWRHLERARMLGEVAFAKFSAGAPDTITEREAEAFFRVDDYVTGKARVRKITTIQNVFGDDPDLGPAIRSIGEKVRER